MNKKWTRKEAIDWIEEHQYIAVDNNACGSFVMDGDGNDLCETNTNWKIDLDTAERAELIAFVLNDYVTVEEI